MNTSYVNYKTFTTFTKSQKWSLSTTCGEIKNTLSSLFCCTTKKTLDNEQAMATSPSTESSNLFLKTSNTSDLKVNKATSSPLRSSNSGTHKTVPTQDMKIEWQKQIFNNNVIWTTIQSYLEQNDLIHLQLTNKQQLIKQNVVLCRIKVRNEKIGATEDFSEFIKFLELPRFKILSLDMNGVDLSGGKVQKLLETLTKHAQTLESLNLSNCKLNLCRRAAEERDDITDLTNYPSKFTKLRELDISHNFIPDELPGLNGDNFPNLVILNINDTKMGNQAHMLFNIPTFISLIELYMDNNELDDPNLFEHLKTLNKLNFLSINGNNNGRNLEITGIENFSNLKTLISEDLQTRQKEIAKKLPKLSIKPC